ncbi:alpha-ketoglutarate-dependent dioxygenase AlkB [Planktothrix sp. FACHB-1355]|uniref:Alpha-ketoglutarate-dependent dioxygenase AlkB n=1 Tax=Aerosakkonema funiforme FACHB-1375 TaxID=2949571 RepID=A0A926ZFR1_9CYAN|nr:MULTISPECIES: alpha-ketoglutarate-dependent dioxygenase AlkB [Oscillatoriales]MBD2181115.1 alpha-ketoglutarate-dependent dioxygenase AlkB [Aerosakkonema funiforme FACHB-1375]MBD3560491.1 alpha-ketoglutarate-dependent dioxygenase AlkB [Planktothrix sp. FACHB-1355]
MLEVPGLKYICDYISAAEQCQLLDTIDRQVWSTELKRRVQHYGYKYNYQKRSVESSLYLGDLPDWLLSIAKQLYTDKLTESLPDQVIINEYEPGQGIAAHIDCVPCFGETIISLSLGSVCVMDFTHSQTKQKIPILLLPGSLLILQKQARYEWQHGIALRKKDKYKGKEFVRTRRISLTFRKVLGITARNEVQLL